MRKFDKIINIQKANKLAEQRYLQTQDKFDLKSNIESGKPIQKMETANFKKLLSLNEGLFDKFKKSKQVEKLEITPNTWTHATSSKELMDHLNKGGEFIGKKENLDDFNVVHKGTFRSSVNQHAPNFKKGDIFSGYEISPYLITTVLSDNAFQPNWNAENYENLKDSNNVGVLKPQYRQALNFKLWQRNKDGDYIQYT